MGLMSYAARWDENNPHFERGVPAATVCMHVKHLTGGMMGQGAWPPGHTRLFSYNKIIEVMEHIS
jgi:hypothetical protein